MLKRRVKPHGLALLFFALCVAGCANRTETAANVAATRGWVSRTIDTPNFDIATWAPKTFVPGQPLAVYVEGDGLAFLSANRVSDDPTPTKPLALQLAVRDPRPNVVYIARPCQFVTGRSLRNCNHSYWTFARYSEAAVSATDAVVQRFKEESGANSILLYGYSGGGAIAALVAARRNDVARLTTVAAVLDHDTWTKLDGMSPLVTSLNPPDFHSKLESIPQVHYVGADDDVVPPSVAKAYQARFPAGAKPPVVVMPHADHECCWVDWWPSLLKKE